MPDPILTSGSSIAGQSQMMSGSGGSAVGSILGGIPLVGGILNGVTQMFTNASNRKFQVSMYNRERADALSDWNMQNAYNSPASQMQRLKAAGLNPNLVYGNGANALEASPVRQSTPSGNNQQAPQFNLGGMIPALMFGINKEIAEMKLQNATTQNIVLQANATNLGARTGLANSQTALNQFELQMDNTLRDVNIAMASGRLDSLYISQQVALDSNERAALSNAVSLQEGIQRILQLQWQNETNPLRKQMLQSQIDNVNSSTKLRDITAGLEKNGIFPGDPAWMRIGSTILNKITSGPGNWLSDPPWMSPQEKAKAQQDYPYGFTP